MALDWPDATHTTTSCNSRSLALGDFVSEYAAYPTAALARHHQQADFAQMVRPALLAVVQAAMAQRLTALFGEHRDA